MFLSVLIVIRVRLTGRLEYNVWGFSCIDADDAMKQARVLAERMTDNSELYDFIPQCAGPAGSFDHLINLEAKD